MDDPVLDGGQPTHTTGDHTDNPEPHPLPKDSDTSRSRSRKSSSLSQEGEGKGNLQDELANHHYDPAEVEKLGDKSTTWTKQTHENHEQNGQQATEEEQQQKKNEDDEEGRGVTEQSANPQPGWGKGITELSSNVIVPDERTEEYQVYADGSRVVAEPIEVQAQQHQPSEHPEVESEHQQQATHQLAEVEHVHHEANPVVSDPVPDEQREEGMNEPEVEHTQHIQPADAEQVQHNEPAAHLEAAEPVASDQQNEEPEVPPGQVHESQLGKKSFELSLEPQVGAIPPQPQEEVHDNNEQENPPPVNADTSVNNGQPAQNDTSMRTVPASEPTIRTGLPDRETTEEEQLLRHEGKETGEEIKLKSPKKPQQEKSRGKETEPCKCSLM